MKRLILAVLTFFILPFATGAQAQTLGGDSAATLRQFYAARQYKPVWTEGDSFNADAKSLPSILKLAATHGIDPETYGVSRMQDELTDSAKAPQDHRGWQQAEIFWTYNLWRYASDLLGQNLDAAMLESLVHGDTEDNLSRLAPDTPLYAALQNRLAQIDAQIKDGGALPARLAIHHPVLRPGMKDEAVPVLRARLADYGATALPADAPPEIAATYDDALVKAVQSFQTDYGLKNDGMIGAQTLEILNRTPQEARMQVIADLQRLREPQRRYREERRIEVSIARFKLTAFDHDRPVLTSPVVVGQPARQTISFRTEITGVRLNPTWTAPDTIRNEDLIPELVSNAARVARTHGNLKVTMNGQTLDPTLIDWAKISPEEMARIRMWAPAGDANPLGFYRVIMANPYDIYLHDTNHRELFAGSMRALSSGCVRVGKPAELTDFILEGKPGWSRQKTKEIVEKGRTIDVVIENKIPIYLDYMTAWLNDRAHLVLGHDLYALDKPRYDLLVNNVLTTQRNAQKLLQQAASILQPEVKEAQSDTVQGQTSN